ncbi:MAG TPA: TspO/MBR family protein [Candidatus Limnocylindria bacterium]
MNDIVALVIAFVVCFGAAGIGGFATSRSLRDWYARLPKPSWNPPNWVFGPVWTVLYALMAIAAWLVWRVRDEHDVQIALVWFAAQLVLNVAWSVAFFGLRSPESGLIVIVLLWWAIAGTIVSFAPLSLVAALLLAPYLAWVTFASALNGAVVGNVAGSRGRF